jgi:hypothetical protein
MSTAPCRHDNSGPPAPLEAGDGVSPALGRTAIAAHAVSHAVVLCHRGGLHCPLVLPSTVDSRERERSLCLALIRPTSPVKRGTLPFTAPPIPLMLRWPFRGWPSSRLRGLYSTFAKSDGIVPFYCALVVRRFSYGLDRLPLRWLVHAAWPASTSTCEGTIIYRHSPTHPLCLVTPISHAVPSLVPPMNVAVAGARQTGAGARTGA